MSFLEVNNISKRGEEGFYLKDIQFSLKKFKKLVIAGETGSGKSTLLKIIAGLVQPDSGEVRLEEKKIEGPEEKLVPGHSTISYLSQHFELPHSLRVEQVLTYANVLEDEQAEQLYKICQIEHLLKRKTNQLSGGERQRIALSRLLITSPKLLLLDEPFAHLDMAHKNTLKEVIRDISHKLKITCILVSHDPYDTLPWADQILVLKEGMIVQKGTSEKIYQQPTNEYVAGLFGKYNVLDLEELKRLSGSKISKKKRIVRPENFSTSLKNKKGLKGIVKQVYFFGTHLEVEVDIGKKSLLVQTSLDIEKGDMVYLTVSPD